MQIFKGYHRGEGDEVVPKADSFGTKCSLLMKFIGERSAERSRNAYICSGKRQ